MDRLINALSTKADFEHYFEICRPKLVVVDADLFNTAKAALMKISGLEAPEIIILGSGGPESYTKVFFILICGFKEVN